MNNNQGYGYPPKGSGQANPPQSQYGNPPNPYGQYPQQTPGMEYNNPSSGPMQMSSNQTNYASTSYPGGGQPQFERSQSNQNQFSGPTQAYKPYESQPQYPSQQPPSQFQSMSSFKQENMNQPVGGGGVGSLGMSGPPAGAQNYNSYHESSHPNPQYNVNQYQPSKQADYMNPNERSQGMNYTQMRNEGSMSHNYGQQNIGGMAPSQQPPQAQPTGPGYGQSHDQNMIGGFLRQNPSQPHFNQSATMDASNNALGGDPNQPSFSYSGMPQNQATGGMGGMPGSNDPNMDIGALNRMAEYYATNSDYPKAIEYFEKMTNI